MAAIQFIMSGAFSIIPPLLPLLMPSLGVHAPGAVRLWAGAMIGVAPLGAALMSPSWGRLSDKFDRRLIILISCVAVALCTAIMSTVTHPMQLLALRFCMGLFGGHVAAGLAVVSAVTPGLRLGYALGWMTTAQLAGTLLGPLIGGGIADWFGNLHAPFFGVSVATVFVAAAIAFVPPRSALAESHPEGSSHHSAPHSMRRDVITWVVVLLLAQCAIMSPQPIVSLRVLELEGQRTDLATLAGLAFSVVALGGLIGSPSIGKLSDTIGARRTLLISLTAAALLTLPQAVATQFGCFVAERFLAGLFLAGIIPAVNAEIGKSASSANRGRTFGIAASAMFLGAFLGPAAGGAAAAIFGLRSVFLGSAGILLITAAWISTRVAPYRR
jgi:DHA1 family multidrug resistance protein-like MFS transporter